MRKDFTKKEETHVLVALLGATVSKAMVVILAAELEIAAALVVAATAGPGRISICFSKVEVQVVLNAALAVRVRASVADS